MESSSPSTRRRLSQRLAGLPPYTYVRVPVALLLLAAAALKTYELVTGPVSVDFDSASGPTGWLQLGAIPIEIGITVLLVVNRWPRIAWGLAVGLFAAFAVFSATGIVEGQETCGCFGKHSPSPATALGLDLFVIFALLMVGPNSGRVALSPHAGSVRLRRWLQPGRRIVYVGGVGAFLVGWQGAAFQMPRPLEVDRKYLDIGNQWEQEAFKWVLPVRNTRDEPVMVVKIGSSCRCTSIEPQSFTVPPGGAVPINLTLDLTAQEAPAHFGENRPIEIVLTPILRGGSPLPIEWTLKGNSRKPLTDGLPPSIEFTKGSVELGRSPSPRRIRIRSKVPLNRLDVTCDPPLCDAKAAKMSGGSQEWIVTLTPVLDGITGYRHGKLMLNVIGDGEKTLAQVSAPIGMWVTSDVKAIPGQLAYGLIPLGTKASETIEFHSASSSQFTIRELSIEGFPAEVVEVVPNRTYRCTVTAQGLGDRKGELRMLVDPLGGDEPFQLIKQLSYHGVSPLEPRVADR